MNLRTIVNHGVAGSVYRTKGMFATMKININKIGGKMNINELVENNMKLVSFTLKKNPYLLEHCEWDDMFQQGSLGLLLAAQRFKEDKGLEFSTFAVSYIWGYMNKYRRDNIGSIKTPRAMADKQTYVFCDSLNRKITNDDGSSSEIGEKLEDDATNWDYIIDNIYIENKLKTIKNDKHKIILVLASKEFTQSEISKKLNMSQAQVSRILKKYKASFIA